MAYADNFYSFQDHLGNWSIRHRNTGNRYGKTYETEEQAWFWFDLNYNK